MAMVRFSAVLLVGMLSAVLANPPPLPGAELVGQAVDILTTTRFGYSRSAGSMLQLNYNMTTQAFDKEYAYPWGTHQPSPISECELSVATLSVKTMEDYQKQTTEEIKVGAHFKSFTGSYSHSTQDVREQLSKDSLWVSVSRTLCVKYQLTLEPGFAQWDPMFLQELKALPLKFNRTSPAAYFSFFDRWNTHIITGCSVGGAESEVIYTKSSYTKDHTEHDLNVQARASFIASIDKTASSKTTVDKEFSEQSTFVGIESHGGAPTDDKQWPAFAQSVMAFTNPVCLNPTLADFAELMMSPWTADGDLHARAPEMQEAMLQYFHRPGCMNPLFPNYTARALQEDGSCGPKVRSLRLHAYIDKLDYVSIRGNLLTWTHEWGVDVGCQDGHNYPTTLTFTMEDGKVHKVEWYPQQNRKLYSPHPLDYCGAPKFTKIEGRDTVKLNELPTVDNAWTTSMMFFDDPKGAAWYEGEVTWTADDECQFGDRGYAIVV